MFKVKIKVKHFYDTELLKRFWFTLGFYLFLDNVIGFMFRFCDVKIFFFYFT